MQAIILLLRKVRREIGFNVVYLGWCVLKLLFNTFRPVPRRVRAALRGDVRRLRAALPEASALLAQAKCFRVAPSDQARVLFPALLAEDREDRWQSTSYELSLLATITWDDVADPQAHVAYLYDKDDAFFRFYPLNKGKNDYWEWYLVPWHRTYGRLAVALLDERMRPLLLPIWRRYDRWYRRERPWMTRLVVGSNVSAVLAGYTLHALMGFLLHEDPREKRRYLRGYRRYAARLHKALRASFDTWHATSIPLEGVLYGGFWFRTAVVLGLVQRALRLDFDLLADPALAGLARYVWQSRTLDGDYQTSGDSKAIPNNVPQRSVFTVLAQVHSDAYAQRLDAIVPQPDVLTGKIVL